MRNTFFHILILLLLFGTIPVMSQSAPSADLIVLPFVNYTHFTEATDSMTVELRNQLEEKAFTVLDTTVTRDILRQHRIRTTGLIMAKDAREIYKETGIKLAMVGSFDFYGQDNMHEVGLHLRIVDLETMYVRYAVSVYEVGLVTDKLFQNGKIEDLHQVVHDAIAKALEGVSDSLLNDINTHPISGTAVPIGVVELDNLSAYLHAGRIISNHVLGFRLHRN